MGCGQSHEVDEQNRPTDAPTQVADDTDLPPAKPPKGLKSDVFLISDYSDVDKKAVALPSEIMYDSFEKVVEYLCASTTSEMGKLRALFTWLTSLDIGKLQGTLTTVPEAQTPLDQLLKIHWQMSNHAFFFHLLCRAAGLKAKIVRGMNKSAAYQIGNRCDERQLAAQWNAVLVDEQWRLVDVFWASTCVVGKPSGEWADFMKDDDDEAGEEAKEEDDQTQHIVNEFFFIPNPEELVQTHFPSDPAWQLMEQPITKQQFEEQTYLRERFFDLNCSIDDAASKKCIIKVPKGEVDIKVNIGNENAKVGFRYMIFKQRQPGKKDKRPPHPLERYVFCTKTGQELVYNIRLPMAGRFKLDIYGQDLDYHDTFDLMCSYLLDCGQPSANLNPLPDDPKIGWGPGQNCAVAGLEATTHKDAIVETDTGEVELRFGMTDPRTVMQSLKSNNIDDWLLMSNALLRLEDKEVILNLRLPETGDYALKLFSDSKTSEGDLSNVCNYLVKCKETQHTDNPYPPTYNAILGTNEASTKLGVKAPNVEKIVELDKGLFEVSFKHDGKSEVYCELTNKDVDSAHLGSSVVRTANASETKFSINLPQNGEYGLNFFSKHKGDDIVRANHVYTYLLKYAGEQEPDPAAPKRPEVSTQKITTSRDSYPIKVEQGDKTLIAAISRKNAIDTVNDDVIKGKPSGDSQIFTVALTDDGEHTLKVYERTSDNHLVLVHVCFITKKQLGPGEEEDPLPEEEIDPEEEQRRRAEKAKEAEYKVYRDQLKAAMASQNPDLIMEAMAAYKDNNVPDPKNELKKAQEMLDYMRVSEGLKKAMADRDLASLEKYVAEAEKKGLEKRLGLQLAMAKQILEKLQRIEKLKKEILNLDQKTIAEIKSYSQPPKQVHQVMTAVFMLLGDKGDTLKDWKAVQIAIGKTGKVSLKRRIGEFNVEKLDVHTAVKVKNTLQPFDLEEVTDVSAGAATFYVWSSTMVEEAESRFVANGGDLKKLGKKK